LITDEEIKILRKFYSNFQYSLEVNKKFRHGSAILSSLEIAKTAIFKSLKDSAIESHKIPSDSIAALKENELIRSSDEISKYIITAKGIWFIEKYDKVIDEDKLVKYIDTKVFLGAFEDVKPLSDEEKIIIFSMLSARAFSNMSTVDMKKDDAVKNIWKELFLNCADKLTEMKIIKIQPGDIFTGKADYEHPMSHFIRHTDKLPRKTKALYRAPGENKYYLDVSFENEIKIFELGYLYWLIFGDKINITQIDELYEFCKQIAYDNCIKLFDMDKHIFANPKYDESIKNGIRESVISKQKWS
jgi:predicted transcriptional regulator